MKRRLDLCEKLFFLMAALQAGAVWLHRSFPTQDGPMQIYAADVLADLIRGSGHYSSYYHPQGYVRPYSFTLYVLTLLNQVFHPLTSERFLVCVYFVTFALAVRFLIRSVDAENHWLGLFLLPFAMNAYLCLGIYNFSYGVVLLMFLMGLWLRWSGHWSVARSLAWLALLMLLAMMHHVPLLILGGFVGAQVAATAVQSARAGGGVPAAWRRVRGDIASAALLAVPIGWYMTFAVASVRSVAPTVAAVEITWLDRIHALMKMLPLAPYMEPGYLLALVMLTVAPLVLLLLRPPGAAFAARSAGIACVALAITAAACLAVFVFGPHFLFGHSHGFFAERMSLPFVICALAAVAPLRLPGGVGRIAAVFAACLFLFTLALRERQTAAIVADLGPLYDARADYRGASGAIISGREGLDEMNFNPYYWAGAIYAQQGKGILLNASGSYEPIGVFGNKGPNPWDDTDSPRRIREILAETRVPVSPPIGFLCGGKWGKSREEMQPAAALAERKGLVRVLDSPVYYCYGTAADAPRASR
jgi:hypothetical protein